MGNKSNKRSLDTIRAQLSALGKDDLEILLQDFPGLRSAVDAEQDQPYRKLENCIEVAERLIWESDQRNMHFPYGNFPDGAWLILLDLYHQQNNPRRVSISSACIAAKVPPTTALRYIRRLLDEGWLIRISDLQDKRKHYLELSETAKLFLTRYLTRICEPQRSKQRLKMEGNFLRLVADRDAVTTY